MAAGIANARGARLAHLEHQSSSPLYESRRRAACLRKAPGPSKLDALFISFLHWVRVGEPWVPRAKTPKRTPPLAPPPLWRAETRIAESHDWRDLCDCVGDLYRTLERVGKISTGHWRLDLSGRTSWRRQLRPHDGSETFCGKFSDLRQFRVDQPARDAREKIADRQIRSIFETRRPQETKLPPS